MTRAARALCEIGVMVEEVEHHEPILLQRVIADRTARTATRAAARFVVDVKSTRRSTATPLAAHRRRGGARCDHLDRDGAGAGAAPRRTA